MKLPQLEPADLADLKPFHLQQRTPLWFYVLREADVLETAGISGRSADESSQR